MSLSGFATSVTGERPAGHDGEEWAGKETEKGPSRIGGLILLCSSVSFCHIQGVCLRVGVHQMENEPPKDNLPPARCTDKGQLACSICNTQAEIRPKFPRPVLQAHDHM